MRGRIGILAGLVAGWLVLGMPLQAQDGSLQFAYTVGGFASASPALSADGETIYIGVEGRTSGMMLAIPQNGGLPRWTRTLPDSISASAAVGSDGTVYVGTLNGIFYALNPATGATKWFVDTRTFVASSPAIGSDGTIYFGAESLLYAVSRDGVVLWRFSAGDAIESSPAIAPDGTIYFGCNDANLYAVAPDGTEKWRFRTGAGIEGSPAIGLDGTIYIGSTDQKMYAVAPSGAKKWEQFTNDQIVASPALGADGTVYFPSFDRNFYALRASDGTILWKTEYGAASVSTAAIRADGTIIFGADDGQIRALNPDGSKLWTFDTKPQLGDLIDSSAIIAPNGSIYIGSLDGHLYKLNGNGSPLSTVSTWPSFRRNIGNTGRVVATIGGGQLANISTRAIAGGGRNLIAGFIVQAPPGRAYLVRAVGPTLGQPPFNIGGFMRDPSLRMYSGTESFLSNNDWEDPDNFGGVADTAAAVGAFPLLPGSKDAAVVTPLSSGAYSAQVQSNDGGVGVALAEVYDVRGTGDPSSRLLNLSTRGFVGTGEDMLIAGFVVRDGPMRLLLRGIGPSLAQFNVPGVLQRPRLEIFRGATSLRVNTGWTTEGFKGDIAGAAATVAAFPLLNNSADCAILFDATAGAYTIQISGLNGTTGEAMVEIYVLP